jgi:transcriptional regulator with XRE-family HTH domain
MPANNRTRSALSVAVGLAVKRLRQARGVSQEWLAEHAGTSPCSVSRLEVNGAVSLESLKRYADALGLPVSKVLEEAERML